MNRDSKALLTIVIVAFVAVIVIVSGLFMYSGMKRPLTVVESSSMQHSDDTSYLGVIDTGDMVVMVSPEKRTVTTFVEGHQNGYSKFGSYGDVVIYYRDGKNPVIHRAILWLDFVDGRWSAPSLKDCPEIWSNVGPWNDLTGNLTLKGLPYKNETLDISINLDLLAHKSGYLTKGDHNNYFDQGAAGSIHPDPVAKSDLKAVAGLEIPWLGCIKLLVNNKNTWMIPENSKTCLFIFFMDVILFIMMVSVLFEYISNVRRRMEEPPTPPFPMEPLT